MTREEAIKILNGILHLNYRNFWDEECDEAIDIAIKALSEDKTDRMTREEAIADIKNNIKPVVGGKSLDMAIEALQDRPTGEWIHQAIITVQGEKSRHEWSCSICGLWGNPDMNYCPNCGARMKGGVE